MRSHVCQSTVPIMPKTSGHSPTRSPASLWKDIASRPVFQLSFPKATSVTFIFMESRSRPYSGLSGIFRLTDTPAPSIARRLPVASFAMRALRVCGQPTAHPRSSSFEKSPLAISSVPTCAAADQAAAHIAAANRTHIL